MAMTRRGFVVSLASLPALLFARRAHAEHYQAKLCGSCGFVVDGHAHGKE